MTAFGLVTLNHGRLGRDSSLTPILPKSTGQPWPKPLFAACYCKMASPRPRGRLALEKILIGKGLAGYKGHSPSIFSFGKEPFVHRWDLRSHLGCENWLFSSRKYTGEKPMELLLWKNPSLPATTR